MPTPKIRQDERGVFPALHAFEGGISKLRDHTKPSWMVPTMPETTQASLFATLVGQLVVLDLRSTYVCLGTLVGCDGQFLEIRDADLHDFRDSAATREVYVHDSKRLGIRRNRQRVLVRFDEVVAAARFDDVCET
jgi:hypothetical protein